MPLFDYAGPERNLGLLYRDAPGMAGQHRQQAQGAAISGTGRQARAGLSRKSSDLAEAYLKWNEPDDAKNELNALDAVWPEAQTNFTGEWAQSWDDWSTRRDAAHKTELDATLRHH